MANYIYLCLNSEDRIVDVMVTEYQMIHNERIEWNVADYTQIGNKYNRSTGQIEPITPEPEHQFTKLEFRHKFTLEELTTIYNAESTDPVIKIFLDDLKVADFICTNDVATQNGIGYLYNAGYITYDRMVEILG